MLIKKIESNIKKCIFYQKKKLGGKYRYQKCRRFCINFEQMIFINDSINEVLLHQEIDNFAVIAPLQIKINIQIIS